VASNTLKRDGSWIVELLVPLKHENKDVGEIAIRSPGLEHVIRWGHGEIPSTLALLAELCDLPEKLLRTITYPDVDRVMLAFTAMMPAMIQADFQAGKRPLASDVDDLPADAVDDQIDPRFPHTDGPVKRFPAPPPKTTASAPKEIEGTGMSLDLPETMKAVG
jgi:hypothetical protein